MAYDRLEVIKSYGEKPLFKVGDEIIPDLADWLLKRVGKLVNVYVCDAHFQITDVEEAHK
jgi:hypothetical protein